MERVVLNESGLVVEFLEPVSDMLSAGMSPAFRVLGQTWTITELNHFLQTLSLRRGERIFIDNCSDGKLGEDFIILGQQPPRPCCPAQAIIRTPGYPINQVHIHEGELWTYDREGHRYELHFTDFIPSNDTCGNTVVITVAEYRGHGDGINMSKKENMIEAQWADEGIKSFFVPRSSPVFSEFYFEEQNGYFWDADAEIKYEINEIENEDGVLLEFEPAIPVSTDPRTHRDYKNYSDWLYHQDPWDFSENHRIRMNISGNEWALAELKKNADNASLILGKEESHAIMEPFYCENETLPYGDEELVYVDQDRKNQRIILRVGEDTPISVPVHGFTKYQDRYVKVWAAWWGCWGVCTGWMEISSFSEKMDLAEEQNAAVLEWENESSWNPALRSILIPRSGPIFQKLSG